VKLHAYIDGASRGNPGPAALGVIIKVAPQTARRTRGPEESGQTIAEMGQFLGETTNNVAEYRALLACFDVLEHLSGDRGPQTGPAGLQASRPTGPTDPEDLQVLRNRSTYDSLAGQALAGQAGELRRTAARKLTEPIEELTVFTDSELLVRQVRGDFRVRQPHLRELHREVMARIRGLPYCFRIELIDRSANREADRLAHRTLNLQSV